MSLENLDKKILISYLFYKIESNISNLIKFRGSKTSTMEIRDQIVCTNVSFNTILH